MHTITGLFQVFNKKKPGSKKKEEKLRCVDVAIACCYDLGERASGRGWWNNEEKAWPTGSSNREGKVCMYEAVIGWRRRKKRTEDGKERWQYVKRRSPFPNKKQRIRRRERKKIGRNTNTHRAPGLTSQSAMMMRCWWTALLLMIIFFAFLSFYHILLTMTGFAVVTTALAFL